jgi:uncharacterized protein (DUF885 family)
MPMNRFARSRHPAAVALATTLAVALAPSTAARAAAAPAPAGGSAAAFERVVHDYYEHYLATHPEEATRLGDHRFDRRSDDVSAAGIAADRALYRRTLEALQAIPAAGLPLDDAVDREILEADLRAHLFDLEEVKDWQWQVTNYSPVDGVYDLIARDYAPLKERLAAANERLKAVPRLIAAAKANLVHPPRVYTETAIAQNQGAIALVAEDLEEPLKQEPSMRPVLAKAREEAIAALRAYGVWLERDLLPRSDGDFRFGRARFEQRLRFSLSSDLPADEVLARAEADAAATQRTMEATARPLFHRYFPERSMDGLDGHAIVRAVFDKIAETHPNNDTVVDEARTALAQATDFVRAHDLVTVPSDPIRVIVMPEFQRGQATAFCDWAGPLEKNGVTFYAISPTPADWSPARVASQYREDNSAMLKDITVHEAMPGHYLQGAHARAVRYGTLVRPLSESGTFIEGWAVYAEQIMAEAGFGGDEVRMQQLKVRLRVALNAILDHRIHVDGMSEQDAMRLMMEQGYQEEGEAAGKWRRAEMSAGQLSTYFVGVQEINALVHDEQAKTGGDLKKARDAILSHGSIATKYVRRLEGLPPASGEGQVAGR